MFQALLENPLFEHIDVYGDTVEHISRTELVEKLAAIDTIRLV